MKWNEACGIQDKENILQWAVKNIREKDRRTYQNCNERAVESVIEKRTG